LSFLPEANTDFVFAVIGEELGLVGTVTVVLLYTALLVAGTRMLRRVDDPFVSLAAFTLLVQIVLQAIINMAVVTALLPPKGLPLPLVSYGGSSLTTSLLSIGIILSLVKSGAQPRRFIPQPHGLGAIKAKRSSGMVQ
jgi:cell division protein FtsW